MCMNLAETEAVGHFKFQLISKISKEVWVWLRVKELRLFPLCTNISVNRLIYQTGIQPLKSCESLGLKSPKNKNLAWLIQTFQLRSKHSTLGMPKQISQAPRHVQASHQMRSWWWRSWQIQFEMTTGTQKKKLPTSTTPSAWIVGVLRIDTVIGVAIEHNSATSLLNAKLLILCQEVQCMPVPQFLKGQDKMSKSVGGHIRWKTSWHWNCSSV